MEKPQEPPAPGSNSAPSKVSVQSRPHNKEWIPTLLIGFAVVGTLGIGAFYRLRKRASRKCFYCNSTKVKRIPQMYGVKNDENADPQETGHKWCVDIFCRCGTCGRARHSKSDNKYFPHWKIQWRQYAEPETFIIDEQLYKDAAIACPVPIHHENQTEDLRPRHHSVFKKTIIVVDEGMDEEIVHQ